MLATPLPFRYNPRRLRLAFNPTLPGRHPLSFSQRLQEIRTGFQPAFWVANITELFERLAFYAQQAVLVVYLHEVLKFSQQESGDLTGFFGGTVWLLPILGGTLADRFGFRRSLALAYLVLGTGYFLLGSLSASWMAPVRESFPLYWLVFVILFIPALGPAVIKPCVVGITARASSENVRSLGYSIYYTLVNVGSTFGPLTALAFRQRFGIESVFRVCAFTAFAMCLATLFFFKEPRQGEEKKVASVAEAFRNLFAVLINVRFMAFLIIFSGFWVMFWQEFISLPLYVRGYVNPESDIELLLTVDPLVVILLTILVSYLFRKMRAFPAMTLGVLVATFCWVLLAVNDLSWQVNTTLNLGFFSLPVRGFPVVGGIALAVLAIGEIIQSPRYYEYISRLAPSGQQGVYMGFAFLPIGIGYYIAGALGGRLVHHYGEVLHKPRQMWWVLVAVGFLTTVLMIVYNRIVKPVDNSPSTS